MFESEYSKRKKTEASEMCQNHRVTERFGQRFRGEAFNITNTPIRPGPNIDWWNREQFGAEPTRRDPSGSRVFWYSSAS